MEHEITKRLRAECGRRGWSYTRGLLIGDDGKRVSKDRFTTVWPCAFTFEEEGGGLLCSDPLSVDQCIAVITASDVGNIYRDQQRFVAIERLGKLDLNSLDSHHNLAEIANALWFGSAPAAWTKEPCQALASRLMWLLGDRM